MKTTRRTFIGGAVAFAPIAGLWAEEAPLLKIGVRKAKRLTPTTFSCAKVVPGG